MIEAELVAVAGLGVRGPYHLGHLAAPAGDRDKEHPFLVRREQSLELRGELARGDTPVVEKHQALARADPLEHRHGLVESHQSRDHATALARHFRIRQPDEQTVAKRPQGWRGRGQDGRILAEARPIRP